MTDRVHSSCGPAVLSSCPGTDRGWRSPGQRLCRSWGTLTDDCYPESVVQVIRVVIQTWADVVTMGQDLTLEPWSLDLFHTIARASSSLKNSCNHTYLYTHTHGHLLLGRSENVAYTDAILNASCFPDIFYFPWQLWFRGSTGCDDGRWWWWSVDSKVRLPANTHMGSFMDLGSWHYLLQVRGTWSDGKSTCWEPEGTVRPYLRTDHCCSISRR